MFKHGSVPYKIISLAGVALIRFVELPIRLFSANKAFYNTSDFSWIEDVEASYPQIKKELQQVMATYDNIPELADLSKEQRRIVQGNKWKTYLFYFYGKRVQSNCAQCAVTNHILQKIPGLITAFYSILEPHTQLTEHRGPYKGVLRYHLALQVPQQANECGIKVNGITMHWQEGKSLLFDDTYLHTAWNNTDEVRVVLFVDVERKLPFPISIINKGMIKLIGNSPFVQNVVRELEG